MSHMLTASGREYHFTGAQSGEESGRPIHLNDIAHQLAMLNRFHGATSRPYSVAEHSLLVSYIAACNDEPAEVQLAALLHDAHEAFTNDLASPAKHGVNTAGRYGAAQAWRNFELDHSTTVRARFGLLDIFTQHGAAIKRYDLIALATERRDLTAWDANKHTPWVVLRDGQIDAINPMPISLLDDLSTQADWSHWRDMFIATFHYLTASIRQNELDEEQAA